MAPHNHLKKFLPKIEVSSLITATLKNVIKFVFFTKIICILYFWDIGFDRIRSVGFHLDRRLNVCFARIQLASFEIRLMLKRMFFFQTIDDEEKRPFFLWLFWQKS